MSPITRIAVIGGSGHIGSYLTPRLVNGGSSVVNISRSQRQPYLPHPAWKQVEQVVLDRTILEQDGSFGSRILNLKPDVVVDLTCYFPTSAQLLVEALRGRISHFLHCGTIWVHGEASDRPTTEADERRPFGDYALRKVAIESYLLNEAKENGFPVTILHPGHLVGVGWTPINPVGNFSLSVFSRLAKGQEVCLPNQGSARLHHVHADDVAQAFEKSIRNRSAAIGEAFHVVSPAPVTLSNYAQTVADWFGKEAQPTYAAWDDWAKSWPEKDAQISWGHVVRSSNCSIEKARRLIEYEPRYTSLDAVKESLFSLIDAGLLEI